MKWAWTDARGGAPVLWREPAYGPDGQTFEKIRFDTDNRAQRWRFGQPTPRAAGVRPRDLYYSTAAGGRDDATTEAVIGEGPTVVHAGRSVPAPPLVLGIDGSKTVWGKECTKRVLDAHPQLRKITLAPDHDAVGYAAMDRVRRRLLTAGFKGEIKVCHPPIDKPQGWDLADAGPRAWEPLLATATPHEIRDRIKLPLHLRGADEKGKAVEDGGQSTDKQDGASADTMRRFFEERLVETFRDEVCYRAEPTRRGFYQFLLGGWSPLFGFADLGPEVLDFDRFKRIMPTFGGPAWSAWARFADTVQPPYKRLADIAEKKLLSAEPTPPRRIVPVRAAEEEVRFYDSHEGALDSRRWFVRTADILPTAPDIETVNAAAVPESRMTQVFARAFGDVETACAFLEFVAVRALLGVQGKNFITVHGKTNTGKTTIVAALTGALGPTAMQPGRELFSPGAHNGPMKRVLRDAPRVVCVEEIQGKALSAGLLKTACGGNRSLVTARAPYDSDKQAITAPFRPAVILIGNGPPKVPYDSAIRNRWKAFKCGETITDDEMIPDFADKLERGWMAEQTLTLLAWAARQWVLRGKKPLPETQRMIRAKREAIHDMAPIEAMMLDHAAKLEGLSSRRIHDYFIKLASESTNDLQLRERSVGHDEPPVVDLYLGRREVTLQWISSTARSLGAEMVGRSDRKGGYFGFPQGGGECGDRFPKTPSRARGGRKLENHSPHSPLSPRKSPESPATKPISGLETTSQPPDAAPPPTDADDPAGQSAAVVEDPQASAGAGSGPVDAVAEPDLDPPPPSEAATEQASASSVKASHPLARAQLLRDLRTMMEEADAHGDLLFDRSFYEGLLREAEGEATGGLPIQ